MSSYMATRFQRSSHLFWRPPIRMLILADPHLEGDAKIARMGWRGRLDIWGNDHYLGHIHRSMRFFTRPTHTVILGDHMSSQWIDDVEFTKRSIRMEDRILKWSKHDKVFNITGNHDIGYAGDMTHFRVNRWELRFGATNFVSHMDESELPSGSTALRVVGMNNLNLDGPALEEDLRGQTHAFLQALPQPCSHGQSATKDGCYSGATILLTHVPMYKEAGLCVDAPQMLYYDASRILLREQNHLSPESTRAVLDKVIGAHEGIVLTGHDHEGCHVMHKASSVYGAPWQAEAFSAHALRDREASGLKAIEEVTVRSVMGQYSGNTGILTAWPEKSTNKWRFHYQAVPFVHNTIWWIVNVVTVLEGIFLLLLFFIVVQNLDDGRLIQLNDSCTANPGLSSSYHRSAAHTLGGRDCDIDPVGVAIQLHITWGPRGQGHTSWLCRHHGRTSCREVDEQILPPAR